MNRLFKVAGLIGGGILSLGTGIIGTHFAHPTLEKNLFPQRINDESKLRESLKEANDQIDLLGIDLHSFSEINSTQLQTISNLNTEVETLTTKVSDKEKELNLKDQEISDKQKQISDQEKINEKQLNDIKDLTLKVGQKQTELTNEIEDKNRIQSNLDYRKTKLALTKEDILTAKTLNMNLLDIKLQKVEFQSFDGEWATFRVTNRDNSTTTIKVNKDSPVDHESSVLKIRKGGIPFGIKKSLFDAWDKKIKLTRYDVDYDYTVKDESLQRCFVKNDHKNEETLKITDYFQDKYLHDAFRVYIAISRIGHFSLRYDWKSTEKRFYFFKDSAVGDFLFKNEDIDFDGFTTTQDKDKFFISTSRFLSVDDFIKYWAQKTVDLVRTGVVDFYDFLNPVDKTKFYVKNS